jgi:Tol biopolymer transport system component
MLRTSRPLLIFAAVFTLLILACSLPGYPRPAKPASTQAVSEKGMVETTVAQTMAAVSTQQPGVTETALPTEGETPNTPAATAAAPPAPSGLTVAYTDTNNNLWVWSEGGQPRQLAGSGDVVQPALSADGSLVAFIRSKDQISFSLWVIHSDGSGEKQLVSAEELKPLATAPDAKGVGVVQLAWVPGQHNLAYNTNSLFEGPGLATNNDLWTVNAESGEKKNVLPAGQGGMFYYSPDGRQIAISREDHISLVNADGSGQRAVVKFAPVATYSEGVFYPAPLWSPASDYLRVVIPPADRLAKTVLPTQIWNIPADGSPASQIGSVTTSYLGVPALSPDLAKLAYLTPVEGAADPNQRQLHISKADGNGDTVFATGTFSFLGWAPDSQHFLFHDGKQAVQLGSLGSAPLVLKDVPITARPEWADANRFLFTSPTTEGWSLNVGTLDGGEEQIASMPTGAAFGSPMISIAGK